MTVKVSWKEWSQTVFHLHPMLDGGGSYFTKEKSFTTKTEAMAFALGLKHNALIKDILVDGSRWW